MAPSGTKVQVYCIQDRRARSRQAGIIIILRIYLVGGPLRLAWHLKSRSFDGAILALLNYEKLALRPDTTFFIVVYRSILRAEQLSSHRISYPSLLQLLLIYGTHNLVSAPLRVQTLPTDHGLLPAYSRGQREGRKACRRRRLRTGSFGSRSELDARGGEAREAKVSCICISSLT